MNTNTPMNTGTGSLEQQIAQKIMEVKGLLEEAGKFSGYFTMSILNGWMHFNNEFWPQGKDEERPVQYAACFDEEASAAALASECSECHRDTEDDTEDYNECAMSDKEEASADEEVLPVTM